MHIENMRQKDALGLLLVLSDSLNDTQYNDYRHYKILKPAPMETQYGMFVYIMALGIQGM